MRGFVIDVARADAESFKRRRDVEILAPGRLVMRSPNGTLFEIVVSNAGAVSGTVLP
jgi:hypothetical protein